MKTQADELFSYVYDFLSMVFEDPNIKDKVRNIILFGSVAKGVYDKDSDVDLFFDVGDRMSVKTLEEKLKRILKSFEVKAEKTWDLKKISLPINFIAGSLENESWRNLKDEIISSGIVLYGSYKEIPDNLKHHYLFYYSLINLDRKKKMKFIRRLFGYNLKNNKKEYKQRGLLEEIVGIKLGPNVILISESDILKIKKLFNEFRIKYRIMEVWSREY